MPHQCTTCGKVFPDGSKEMLSGCPNCGGNKFQFKPASNTGGNSGSVAGGSDDTHTQGGAGTQDLTSSAADAVRKRATETESRPDTGDEEVTVSDWVNSKGGTGSAADAGATDTPSTPSTDAPSGRTPDSPGDSGEDPSDEAPPRGWGEWPNAPDESSDADSSAASDATPREPQEAHTPSAERRPPHIRARETDEDNSQKSARSDVVTPEELAAAGTDHGDSTEQPQPGVTPSDHEGMPEPQETASPGDVPSDVDGTAIEPSSEERPNLDQLREELNDQFESIKIVNPGQYELNLMELYDRDEYIISLREDGRYVIEVPDTWGPGSRED